MPLPVPEDETASAEPRASPVAAGERRLDSPTAAAPVLPPGYIIRTALALLMVLTLIGVSLWIVLPFIVAMVWGGIIAISAYPAHRRLATALRGYEKTSATIIGVLMGVLLLGPLTALFLTLGQHATRFIEAIPEFRHMTIPPPPAWLENMPILAGRLLNIWNRAQTDMAGTIESLRPQIVEAVQWVLQRVVASAGTILQAILAIVMASVFLVAGPRLGAFFVQLFEKLGVDESEALVAIVDRTVSAVAKGIIGTAMIQAIGFWIGLELAGAPFPLGLAFLALVLCSIQLGVGLIGLMTAGWMWMHDQTGPAVFVFFWSIFINTIDNFIKPILIGRDFPVPIWVGFLGVIGGLLSMGLVGLFVGPVVLVVGYRLLVGWTKT